MIKSLEAVVAKNTTTILAGSNNPLKQKIEQDLWEKKKQFRNKSLQVATDIVNLQLRRLAEIQRQTGPDVQTEWDRTIRKLSASRSRIVALRKEIANANNIAAAAVVVAAAATEKKVATTTTAAKTPRKKKVATTTTTTKTATTAAKTPAKKTVKSTATSTPGPMKKRKNINVANTTGGNPTAKKKTVVTATTATTAATKQNNKKKRGSSGGQGLKNSSTTDATTATTTKKSNEGSPNKRMKKTK